MTLDAWLRMATAVRDGDDVLIERRWGVGARGGTDAPPPISSRKTVKDLTLCQFIHKPPSTQNTTRGGTRCDGLNEAVDVCIDGSIRTLLLIRHHLLTYVCNTDNWNNNGSQTSVKELSDLHSPE